MVKEACPAIPPTPPALQQGDKLLSAQGFLDLAPREAPRPLLPGREEQQDGNQHCSLMGQEMYLHRALPEALRLSSGDNPSQAQP